MKRNGGDDVNNGKVLKDALSSKQREKYYAIANNVVKGMGIVEACRKVGYRSESTSSRIANDERYQEILKECRQEYYKKNIATAEEVQSYLTEVMRGNVKDSFDIDASISDRNKAAELLGKAHKIFTDRIELSGNVDIATALEQARQRAKQAGDE